MTFASSVFRPTPRTFWQKFFRLNWGILITMSALALFGVIMHFSVSEGLSNANLEMPLNHGVRFIIMLGVVIVLAMVDVRVYLAIAYPLYALTMLLLVGVEVAGETRMGATRWLDIGPFALQPSEIMKVAIVLALARFYHQLDPKRAGTFLALIPPVLMIAAPVALVMHQPDLGTGVLIALAGLAMMVLGGLPKRYIIATGLIGAVGAFFAYQFVLHDYQRARVDVFLGIAKDPLGEGYHVLQSMIAIGSAGLFGRGYLQGTQSQLDFLPEKHTDFIFTMIVEELGLVGGFAVLFLFGVLMVLVMAVAMRTRSLFGKMATAGVAATLACYVFINTSMVIGLAPVVGIPLPLISYGGTAMMTLMAGLGIVLSVDLHRDHLGSRGFLW